MQHIPSWLICLYKHNELLIILYFLFNEKNNIDHKPEYKLTEGRDHPIFVFIWYCQ